MNAKNLSLNLSLTLLEDTFAICRLNPNGALPGWSLSDFFTITRTQDELSIVCAQALVPEGIQHERDWRCLKVNGTLDFALTGILAALTAPLAEAEISLFAISTYDTDYLLVREQSLEQAIAVLEQASFSTIPKSKS